MSQDSFWESFLAHHHHMREEMRKIGLIGGLSWESSKLYYEVMNNEVKQRCGGLHSAEIIMVSVDFAPVEACLKNRDWQGVASHLIPAAQQLETAGAEAVLLCTNTMHKIADEISDAISIPFFHIIDALGQALKAEGRKKAGLLGTTATMQNKTYQQMLKENYGVECILPSEAECEVIDQIIFEELCLGIISAHSKEKYLHIIENLAQKGADSIILGCTEITLLLTQQDCTLKVFDTTALHAVYAVNWALETTET